LELQTRFAQLQEKIRQLKAEQEWFENWLNQG
jgi:hypothetical protein